MWYDRQKVGLHLEPEFPKIGKLGFESCFLNSTRRVRIFVETRKTPRR